MGFQAHQAQPLVAQWKPAAKIQSDAERLVRGDMSAASLAGWRCRCPKAV